MISTKFPHVYLLAADRIRSEDVLDMCFMLLNVTSYFVESKIASRVIKLAPDSSFPGKGNDMEAHSISFSWLLCFPSVTSSSRIVSTYVET